MKGSAVLQILMNMPQKRLEVFSNATGIKFLSMENPDKESVAVVVQGELFQNDLSTAVSLGTPVVVIAGSDNKIGNRCAQEAVERCVPQACILLKKGDKVCTLDGKTIADAVGQGIGVRAVIKTAECALKNGLYPEPLVWQESEEIKEPKKVKEPVVFGEEWFRDKQDNKQLKKDNETKKTENNIVQSRKINIENILGMTNKVMVVFRATQDANSEKVACDLTKKLNGVHLELAKKATSFNLYGDTLKKAAGTGRYAYYDGKVLTANYINTEWLIVEIDTDVLLDLPQMVDIFYRKAEKVVHAVGEFEEGKIAIETWINSGWNLHAVIPNKAFEKFRQAFGEIVFASVDDLV